MASKRKNNTSNKLAIFIAIIIIVFLLFTINKQKETINKTNLQLDAANAKVTELQETLENNKQEKTLKILEIEKKYEADIKSLQEDAEKQENAIKELKEQNASFDKDNAKLKEEKQGLEVKLEEEKQKTEAAIAALHGNMKKKSDAKKA